MSTLLLDTHVVHWWSAEPDLISRPARRLLKAADELLIAAVSWYELAWLAERQRIVLDIPIRSWLGDLSAQVRTLGLTYATAIEHGVKLVTKNRAIAAHDKPRSLVVW
jgi:PIN domain nuclease of toxin-antitoxin system